jgi:NADH dehydrogenase/NADH:ubiquinone oxidoreductase subunit G
LSAAKGTLGLPTSTVIIPATENSNAARVTHGRTTPTVNVIPHYFAARVKLGKQTLFARATAAMNAAQAILSQATGAANVNLVRIVAAQREITGKLTLSADAIEDMNAAQVKLSRLILNSAHAILWLNAAQAKTIILNSVCRAKKVRPGEKISTALLATQKRSAAQAISIPTTNFVLPNATQNKSVALCTETTGPLTLNASAIQPLLAAPMTSGLLTQTANAIPQRCAATTKEKHSLISLSAVTDLYTAVTMTPGKRTKIASTLATV